MNNSTDTHEETAGAVGAAAGGQTPQEGIKMSESSVTQDTGDGGTPPSGALEKFLAAQRANDERMAAWLRDNSVRVATFTPQWAEPSLTWADVIVGDADDDVDLVAFSRDMGTVVIEQSFYIDHGEAKPERDPRIRLAASRDDEAVFEVEQAQAIAVEILAAARLVQGGAALTDVYLSDLFRIGRELGVPPGRIMALSTTGDTTTQIIATKIRLAADLLEEAAELEAQLSEGDEDALAEAIRPHLTRIGVALGEIPADALGVS